MKIHYIQHVPFEDMANIEVWAKEKGYKISGTKLFNNETLPQMEDFDWLVIPGGPMNIYEEKTYPWLAVEKKFIAKAITARKTLLGICLGAQLIAHVLGAKIKRNNFTEIGWFPVTLTAEAKSSPVFAALPEKFTAFHWHGDTFEIPPGAVRVAESEACANQAFVYSDRVIGLQFHLEYSPGSISRMIENCGDELVGGKFIQEEGELLAKKRNLRETKNILDSFLDNMERECEK
ncbi:MAG: type 1 glutamine amidotransferase [Candidatus Methanoperedens sp.]|nr:type 1 glutamine amidotransferase [Candidatus Methanoperedens sp.]